MLDYFDFLYTSIQDKRFFLKKIRFYSFCRFLIRLIANIILPIYFIFTNWNKRYYLKENKNSKSRIIVSLTSFPARINRVWIVVESLLRQQTKPDMIILWLSIEQFPTKQTLPKSLIRLQKRGLTIRLCMDDLRSHKKYFYALKEFPEDYIITVDDDVFYNSQLLSYLIELNHKFPKAICCNEASRIVIKDGLIEPYLSWDHVESENNPSSEIIPIGVGGILYPPNSLNHDVFNIDIFKKYCFLGDDIWLNLMGRLNRTLVAKTAYNSTYIPILNRNNITLNSINRSEGYNDKQLISIRDYYITYRNIDPYKNILSINSF